MNGMRNGFAFLLNILFYLSFKGKWDIAFVTATTGIIGVLILSFFIPTTLPLLLIIVFTLIIAYIIFPYKVHLDRDFDSKSDECLRSLYRNAKSEIEIVTDLDPDFFNKEEIIQGFRKAKSNGVNIKILYDKQVDDKTQLKKGEILEGMYNLKKEGIVDMKPSKESLVYHFMVTDGKNVRIEQKHDFQTFEKSGRYGLIIENNLELGEKCQKNFNNLWVN